MGQLTKKKSVQRMENIRKRKRITSKSLDEVLEIKITPDPPAQTFHKTVGKKSGLGIMAFWSVLFSGNEQLPKGKKMTNAEIERQVRMEFSHERTLMHNLETKRQTVNYYRHLYNSGRLTKPRGNCPEYISYRYNDKGERVDTRTGKRPLTQEQIDAIEKRFREGR